MTADTVCSRTIPDAVARPDRWRTQPDRWRTGPTRSNRPNPIAGAPVQPDRWRTGPTRPNPIDDVALIDGVPTLSAARTWVNLAESLSLPDVVAAGDSALRGSTTSAELTAAVARARHTPGVVVARRALELLDARSRSRPESHLRVAIVTAGLPTPQVNVAVHTVSGEWLFEPDLSYDDVRLALEYNGATHADPSRMRRDITRELDGYERGGWFTVTLGPRQVFGRPDQIGLLVERLRRERGA